MVALTLGLFCAALLLCLILDWSILYALLTALDADIRLEEPTAKGRADIVLKMPKHIYVVELKVDDTADNALAQINTRGYADKYRLDGRPVTKVGIAFSSKERNITEWRSEDADGGEQ